MSAEGLCMKKIHVPIIIETGEDGVHIVSCPLFERLPYVRQDSR